MLCDLPGWAEKVTRLCCPVLWPPYYEEARGTQDIKSPSSTSRGHISSPASVSGLWPLTCSLALDLHWLCSHHSGLLLTLPILGLARADPLPG